jgi:hypothetical protein
MDFSVKQIMTRWKKKLRVWNADFMNTSVWNGFCFVFGCYKWVKSWFWKQNIKMAIINFSAINFVWLFAEYILHINERDSKQAICRADRYYLVK